MDTPDGPLPAPVERRRVVYLLGAGATHASVSFAGGTTNLLMAGLIQDLAEEMKSLIASEPEGRELVLALVNEVLNAETDFEQVTTFLEDAPSLVHRNVAARFKEIFFRVLSRKLDATSAELGASRSHLYAALVDMHQVERSNETLLGFITLNYDGYLEHAIETHLGRSVDYGVSLSPTAPKEPDAIRVLKLHGSFSWTDGWPMALTSVNGPARWIPPGIRKVKGDYPFNAIWGLARELLDCDVVRIIGCRLGANDWDLVSLLFTTMRAHVDGRKYQLEVIGRPTSAERIKEQFPYLQAKSLLEIDDIGDAIVAELLGSGPTAFDSLEDEQKVTVRQSADRKIGNPLEYWLVQMGEAMTRDLGDISTETGQFESFLASH